MSSSAVGTSDVINAILGIHDDSPIAHLRNQKPELIGELQAYYDSIFSPTETSAQAFPVADRLLVAVRVASHTDSHAVANWYATLAGEADVPNDAIDQVRAIATHPSAQSPLGAALRHADLLTTRPAEARKHDLDLLKQTGFTPAGIVSLSQTIAFVSYQVRLIAGLRALGDRS